MRSGVIAQKLGMTRVYNDAGEHVPVTVLRQVENCHVVAQRTVEKNGYIGCSAWRWNGQGKEHVQGYARSLREGRGRAEGAKLCGIPAFPRITSLEVVR